MVKTAGETKLKTDGEIKAELSADEEEEGRREAMEAVQGGGRRTEDGGLRGEVEGNPHPLLIRELEAISGSSALRG